MAVPSLAVVNFTTTLHTDEVNEAIHAVNRQITENFAPIWGIARMLERLVPNFHPEDPDTLAEALTRLVSSNTSPPSPLLLELEVA